MAIDWLIIGGGPHGVHLAARLLSEGVPTSQLMILDPAPALLHQWRTRTQATGMTYLRSPSVHNIDLDPFDLNHFAKRYRKMPFGLFTVPYKRPSLKLFNEHCDDVIDRFDLASRHLQDRAIKCSPEHDAYVVTTQKGNRIKAKQIVLAIGQNATPLWPDWVPAQHPAIDHIFSDSFRMPKLEPESQVAVIGGGITAAQVALRIVKSGYKAHVISRHSIRVHQFDSDPGWLGPKYLVRFGRENCMARRRSLIKTARHRGSMPADVKRSVQSAKLKGDLNWHTANVQAFKDQQTHLQLKLNDAISLQVKHVILATGFQATRPGGALVDNLQQSLDLPVSPCGYPIVDEHLRWADGLHVMGALAELKLGPTARNIIGARHAAERIMEARASKALSQESARIAVG